MPSQGRTPMTCPHSALQAGARMAALLAEHYGIKELVTVWRLRQSRQHAFPLAACF